MFQIKQYHYYTAHFNLNNKQKYTGSITNQDMQQQSKSNPSQFQFLDDEEQSLPKLQAYTLKSLQNCTLQCPSGQSQCQYYQINVPKGPAIRIYFMTHSIIRVRLTFGTSHRFREQSYSLVMTAWEDRFDQLLKSYRKKIKPLVNVNFSKKVNETEGEFYYFQTNQLTGKIFINPYGLEIYNRNGVVLYRDLRGRAYKRDQQGRVYHYSQINQTSDCFYGFGQNTGKLNKIGCRMRLAPQDSLGYNAETTAPLYKHIPFYIKVNRNDKHAIGLFYNNSYEASFDMGSQRSGYWPRYSYYCADGGDIDLFIINGPAMKHVIQRYTDLTGKTALAPLQSLGYLGSTMYYAQLEERCDVAIIQFVKKCKRQNVPISNFHLSSGYTMSQNKMTPKRFVFTWNSKKFPNPSQFFSTMKQLGVQVSPNIKPGILTVHPYYEQFASHSAFIQNPDNITLPYVDRWWGGQGSFVDFTDPIGRKIWKSKLKQQIILKGTTSIWNDNNEYESLDNRSAVCSYEWPIFFDNKTGLKKHGTVDQLKTVQSLLMAHVADEAIKQEKHNCRPYIVSRSGCAGIQRYASSWSGDNYTQWKTLKANIPTMLNMGLSGVANYGSDIGGFWGPAPSAELFLRWVQHGIFQPRFSIHSCNSDNTVTQPWMFPQFSALIAKTIRFRYLLLPYLYSLLYYSHIKGRPIMRPLVYEFQLQDFEACAEQRETFMFGPYMLVANVLQPLSGLNKKNDKNNLQQVDCTTFPNVNLLVPNCVEMNECEDWSSQSKGYSTLLYNQQPHISQKGLQSVNTNQNSYKQIYLPKGCNWYSWNGRQKYEGGSRLNLKVNYESIPLFVKDRSIIPLAIKFGKNQSAFDLIEMNKQQVSGLYFKITYDTESYENYKAYEKNYVSFSMLQDDGIAPLLLQSKKKQEQKQQDQVQYQANLSRFSRLNQNKLNKPIPSNANFLVTKMTVKNTDNNKNMISIDVSRQGNLQLESINNVDTIILQLKSIDKSPIWITINDEKCKQVLYESEWVRWKQDPFEKIKSENRMKESEVMEVDQLGCWYYDHGKGAAILKINKSVAKPAGLLIEKYRNLRICVCKDPMIQFSKEYSKINEQLVPQIQSEEKLEEGIKDEDDTVNESEILDEEAKEKYRSKRKLKLKEKNSK